MNSPAKSVELFVSYAHVDEVWFKRLLPVLNFNHCRDKAYAWNDDEMSAGDRWDKKIKDALEVMDVFVCLVSYDFLASGYIKNVEIKRALQREKNKEVEIVPILLYPMDMKKDCPKLYPFNPLPAWNKPWSDVEQESGHYQVAHKPIRNGLRQAIDNVNENRKTKTP